MDSIGGQTNGGKGHSHPTALSDLLARTYGDTVHPDYVRLSGDALGLVALGYDLAATRGANTGPGGVVSWVRAPWVAPVGDLADAYLRLALANATPEKGPSRNGHGGRLSRSTKGNPCPICDNDACSVTEDGLRFCLRSRGGVDG